MVRIDVIRRNNKGRRIETTRDAVSKEHALPLSQKRSAMVNSLMKFILWFRHFGHFPRGRVLHPFFVDIPKIRRKKAPLFSSHSLSLELTPV